MESPRNRSKLQESHNYDQVISDAIRQLKSKGTMEDGQLKKFNGLRIRIDMLYRGMRIIVSLGVSDMIMRTVHSN